MDDREVAIVVPVVYLCASPLSTTHSLRVTLAHISSLVALQRQCEHIGME